MRCSFSLFSPTPCGSSTYFPNENNTILIEKCDRNIQAHLQTLKLNPVDIPAESNLICYRVGIFSHLQNYTICPSHRYSLGIRWRKSSACTYVHHTGKMKPDRAVSPKMSKAVLMIEGSLLQVGSGICRKCRELVYRCEEKWASLAESSCTALFQDIPNDESLNMLKDQDQELVTDLKAEYSSSIVRKRARRILSQDSLHLTTHALQKQEMSECLQSSSQELTESSQEISSQGSNWSTDEGVNDLMVYNEAITRLGKGKISPLKYQLGSSISDITSQGKNYIKRKAQQVVNIALDMIAPGQADDLITLITPQNLEPALNGDSIELLKKLYEEATDKTVKEQLLSVMAIIATKDRVIDILGVTKYKVDKVRALTLDALKAKNEAPPKKRQRMDEGKLDHALSFFFDSAFHQLVSYGTREMTLENGEEIIIPDVVRTACHSTMVNMYQSYCQEENFIPLSRSTLFKILRSCSAAKRKNLHGLDNTTADGMKAFSDLEKIATNAYEQGIIDKDLQRNLQSGLLQGKNYLKCQYKFHVFLNSNCADHCIQWALSDPKDNCFHVECAHHHDTQCRQCNFLVETISKFDEIPLAEDEVKDVSVAKLHIANWKGHILRTVNQDRSRIEHIDNLLPKQMFIVMDWAMKFLPQLHREKQSDWFGQKGISWHVAVCMYKTDIEVKHQTMVHILESGKQDWFAVASILEHLLVTIKQQQPQVDQVFLRSDNAGCYHCGQLWSSLHAIGHRTRIQIKDYHFSEAQSGKSYCDAKIAHLRRKIRSYVSEGNDVRLPMEMKAALDSYGGVTGCQVAVVEVNYAKQTLHSHKIKDVLSIANVEVHENSLQFRKGYEIGPGKYLQNISSLVNNTQAETGLKVIKGFDVPKNVAGKINVSNTRDPESNTSELFTCTEEGCVKSFTSFTAYEHHLHCERHTYQLEGLSGFDKIKLRWAESCNNENSRNSVVTSIQESDELDARQVAVNGWALKKERKVIRFKPKVHEYLKEIFKAGEISGKKANPIEVAANMRTLKDDHNIRQFQPEDCLQPSQIVSYFSRLATQAKSSEKKQETVKEVTSHDDDEFLTSLLQDMELQEIRNDVQSKVHI